MARLETCGFEHQLFVGTVAGQSESPNFVQGATVPLVETSIVRSGGASMKIESASQYGRWNVSGTTSTVYFLRTYMQFDVQPTAVVRVLNGLVTNTTAVSVRTPANATTLALFDTGNNQIGSASASLNVNQWYRVELKIQVNTTGSGVAELQIDGVSIASTATGSFGTTALNNFRVGQNGTGDPGTSVNFYFDDVALNDDSAGGTQTSWPGSGKVAYLKPISDNAKSFPGVAGWTRTDTFNNTDLYVGCNTIPLVVGSPTPRITDTDNGSTTDTYDANLQTFTTGGVAAADTVVLTRALARFASAASITGGVVQQSNTSSTEGTVAAPTSATVVRDTTQYAPSVTRGSSPVVRVRKGTSSATALNCDVIGLYVEYLPPLTLDLADTVTVTESPVKEPGPVLSETATTTESPVKEPGPVLSDTATSTESPVKEPGPVLSDTATSTESTAKDFVQGTISDTATVTESPAKDFTQGTTSDSVTVAESPVKEPGPVLPDTATVTESPAKEPGPVLSDTATASESPVKEPGPGLSDTATASESRTAEPGPGLSDTATASESAAKDFTQGTIAETANVTDARSAEPGPSLSDSATVTESRSAEPGPVLSDAATISEVRTAEPGPSLADTATVSDANAKDFTQENADTATVTDARSAEPGPSLPDTATVTESPSAEPGPVLADAVTASDQTVLAPVTVLGVSAIASTEEVGEPRAALIERVEVEGVPIGEVLGEPTVALGLAVVGPQPVPSTSQIGNVFVSAAYLLQGVGSTVLVGIPSALPGASAVILPQSAVNVAAIGALRLGPSQPVGSLTVASSLQVGTPNLLFHTTTVKPLSLRFDAPSDVQFDDPTDVAYTAGSAVLLDD